MSRIDCFSTAACGLTVTVEPLVEVGTITDYLVPQGYMLATTLEIEEATIGGLAMAVGMTTASHKHGLLQETVTEYEMVLGDGSRRLITKESDPDLFHTLPWSHGSLGFLVGLTLRIIPVKPYVELKYQACHTQETLKLSVARAGSDQEQMGSGARPSWP